jgi:hypothetical protein
MHDPATHVFPDAQAFPQAPQFAVDVVGSTQTPEQRICGLVQETTQFPALHVFPDGQALPQAPQFAVDVVGSTQAPEQMICGLVQEVAVGIPKSERSAEFAVVSLARNCFFRR